MRRLIDLKSWFLGLFLLMAFSQAHASVWQTTRHWDDAADEQFEQWVRALPLDILSNPSSKYAGIETDCADAAYALRIIFAYENGLPVRFQDRSDLSNETSKFDGLASRGLTDASGVEHVSPRLLAFIRFVGDETDTQTLSFDTYPVEINGTSLRPGLMFLHASSKGQEDVPVTYRSGHVYYLKNIYENGLIRYIGSTVPLAVRSLSERLGIIFAPQETDSGYRAWKRPDSDARPFYSEEQFQLGGWYEHSFRDGKMWVRWQEAIQARFRTRRITPKEQLQANTLNLRAAIQERATAVLEGWQVYQEQYGPGQCMDETDYENYSTPTRDGKIQSELQQYTQAAKAYLNSSAKTSGNVTDSFLRLEDPTQARARNANEQWLLDLYKQTQFEVMPGENLNVLQLWRAFWTKAAIQISEPEHSPQVRWGLADQGQWPCPERRKQYKGAED